jgi:hypothetical protein
VANVFERSLFKIGDGGIALVIPKSFAIAHHLEPGDVLRVKNDRKARSRASGCCQMA